MKPKNIIPIRVMPIALTVAVCIFGLVEAKTEDSQAHRALRVALYPLVPEKAELFLKVLQDYRVAHPEIDLTVLDIGANYYGGGLVRAVKGDGAKPAVDVAEVDTIFLRDFLDQNLIDELPKSFLQEQKAFLPLAALAVTLNGKLYGVPHWVCGDFIFFRRDDPDAGRFDKAKTLKDLEGILGQVASESDGLMTELKGKSTLGEMYLHSLIDEYQTPEEALKHIQPTDASAVNAIQRLCALCPGALDHVVKFHAFGQYYARQFTHCRARAILGYSESLYDVENEFLHGVGLHEKAAGEIYKFDPSVSEYVPYSTNDVRAIAAPVADRGEKMLAWVDALCIRRGLSSQARKDAMEFIRFYTSEEFNRQVLIPTSGAAPRYLLPARLSLYNDPQILVMAPLYPTFLEIMKDAVSVTAPHLNDDLRKIGGEIDHALPTPQ